MAIDIEKLWIYHITSVQNLRGIIQSGGLWSDTERERQGIVHSNIAHSHIKERRKKTRVTVGPYGVVADYVPFYFCPRSPMLFAIHQSRVENCSLGQQDIVYLCAKVSCVIGNTAWCASNGHTDISALCTFFNTPAGFTLIDWDAVRTDGWGYPDYTTDSDLKRRKQAEFLVPTFFPWNFVGGIGVMDATMEQTVRTLLQQAELKPQVAVKRHWYFKVQHD